jgi:hypothetical protein
MTEEVDDDDDHTEANETRVTDAQDPQDMPEGKTRLASLPALQGSQLHIGTIDPSTAASTTPTISAVGGGPLISPVLHWSTIYGEQMGPLNSLPVPHSGRIETLLHHCKFDP